MASSTHQQAPYDTADDLLALLLAKEPPPSPMTPLPRQQQQPVQQALQDQQRLAQARLTASLFPSTVPVSLSSPTKTPSVSRRKSISVMHQKPNIESKLPRSDVSTPTTTTTTTTTAKWMQTNNMNATTASRRNSISTSSPSTTFNHPSTSTPTTPSPSAPTHQQLQRALSAARALTPTRPREAITLLSHLMDATTTHLEALNLAPDSTNMNHNQKLLFWAGVNAAWIAAVRAGVRGKSTTAAVEDAYDDGDDQYWREVAANVVAWCDVLEWYGLVDYECGFWENDILTIVRCGIKERSSIDTALKGRRGSERRGSMSVAASVGRR